MKNTIALLYKEIEYLNRRLEEKLPDNTLAKRIEFIETEEFQKGIVAMVVVGHYIPAIKAYREQTRTGLREAKEMVDLICGVHGYVRDLFSTKGYYVWKKVDK